MNSEHYNMSRLNDTLDSMRAVVWSVTFPQLKLTYLSPSAKKLFGCEARNIDDNGTLWEKNIHPDDISNFLDAVEKAPKDGEAAVEHRIIGNRGETYWVRNHIKANFNDEGEAFELNGVMIEETSLKKSEDQMTMSKERLKSILKVAPIGIGVVSNRIITEVNLLFCKMTGYSREELIGQRSAMLYPTAEDYEYVGREKYQQIRKNGTGTVETRILKKNGEIIDVIMSSAPIDPSDLSKGVTFTLLDITERKRTEKELLESKRRYKAILENSPMSILLTRNGDIIYSNPIAASRMGYSSPEELIGIDIDKMVSSESIEFIQERMQNLSNGIANSPARIKLIRKDGKEYITESASVPVIIDDEPATLIMGIDITDRIKAEEQLRKNEKFLRRIFDVLPVGLWLADKNGKLINANPAGKKIWGAEPHVGSEEYGIFKARRYPSMEELKPEDWALARSLREGITVENELLEIDTFDDKKRTILNYTSPVFDDDGNSLGFVIVNNDVTEKTRIDAELKSNLSFMRTLLNTIPNPIYYKDKDGIYTECNEAFARGIFGLPKEKIIGKTLCELAEWFPDDLMEIYELKDNEIMNFGGKQAYEVKVKAPDNELRDYINSRATLYGPDHEITGIIGVMLDITDRKRAEKEIFRAKIEAEAANRTKSEFLTTMSHELRTPLNAIIGYSDMLIAEDFGALNEKQARFSKHIYDSGKHLLNLINDILDISKIESGKVELIYEDFSLREIMEDVRNITQPLAIKKHIKLNFPAFEYDITIKADGIKFKQMLYNLVNNAVKFTPNNGKVTVTADMTGGKLQVSVADTGVGISEEEQKKLFTPFYQVDSSCSREYQGTGIGLSVTKKLVELHRGKITVESIPGKGSTFTIIIPVKP